MQYILLLLGALASCIGVITSALIIDSPTFSSGLKVMFTLLITASVLPIGVISSYILAYL